jgi:hypothetical protein
MKAEEARKIAFENKDSNLEMQRTRVYRKIETAAKQSKTGIEIQELLLRDLHSELLENGYRVAEKAVEPYGWTTLIIW